jgi:hypothetical protein
MVEPSSPLTRFLRRIQQAGFLLPSALTAYLWLKAGQPHLPGWSCPLRALSGIPCPTCFLTRATELALRGDLHGSVQQHAFGPLMAISLLLWSLAAIRQRRLLPHPLDKPMPTWLPALALMALLGYWVLRLRLGFGVALAGPGTGR